jgi:hypothetical protein
MKGSDEAEDRGTAGASTRPCAARSLIAGGTGSIQRRGRAIIIEGARLGDVRRAAMSFRAGGVGTYWHNGFIHVDTGRIRYWRPLSGNIPRRIRLEMRLRRNRSETPLLHFFSIYRPNFSF